MKLREANKDDEGRIVGAIGKSKKEIYKKKEIF